MQEFLQKNMKKLRKNLVFCSIWRKKAPHLMGTAAE